MWRCWVSKKIQTGSSEGSSSRRILEGSKRVSNRTGEKSGKREKRRKRKDALDRLLNLVQSPLRVPQPLPQRRPQISNNLLHLSPNLVVNPLLLLLLLRRGRNGQTEELGGSRGEDVAAFFVGLECDLISTLCGTFTIVRRIREGRFQVDRGPGEAKKGTRTHLLDCLAQNRRQVEEELAPLEHAQRAL